MGGLDRQPVHAVWWFVLRVNDLFPGGSPPFCASRRAMRFDVGRVDGSGTVDSGVSGQGIKDLMPDALAAPPVEAIVDRRVGAVLDRTVSPSRTASKHVDDA